MEEATLSFKARAERALADPTLKIAIDRSGASLLLGGDLGCLMNMAG